MPYDTIIFDLDGTLLNTLDDLADSTNYALSQMGFPCRTIDEVRQFVGNGVKLLIDRAVPTGISEDKKEKCLSIFKEYYSKNMENKTRPYDGIIEMLSNLKKLNINIAVVSNKFDRAVKGLCEKYFSGYVNIAVGESEKIRKKPAPDSVLEVIKILGSSKESTLYVGDSDVDVITAHNAKIKCIGVTWGFRDKDLLQSCGADYIIDKPCQINDILK